MAPPVSAWGETSADQKTPLGKGTVESKNHVGVNDEDQHDLDWLEALPPDEPLDDEDISRISRARITLHMAWRTQSTGDEDHFYWTLEQAGLEFMSTAQKLSFWEAALRTAQIDDGHGELIAYSRLAAAVEANRFPGPPASTVPQAVVEQPLSQSVSGAAKPDLQKLSLPCVDDLRQRLLTAMKSSPAGIRQPAALLPGKGCSPSD